MSGYKLSKDLKSIISTVAVDYLVYNDLYYETDGQGFDIDEVEFDKDESPKYLEISIAIRHLEHAINLLKAAETAGRSAGANKTYCRLFLFTNVDTTNNLPVEGNEEVYKGLIEAEQHKRENIIKAAENSLKYAEQRLLGAQESLEDMSKQLTASES